MFQPNEQDIDQVYKLVVLSTYAYKDPQDFRKEVTELNFTNCWGGWEYIYYFWTSFGSQAQAYICRDNCNNIYVVFRGSQTTNHWKTNIACYTIPTNDPASRLHAGFMEAAENMWKHKMTQCSEIIKGPYKRLEEYHCLGEVLANLRNDRPAKIWFTGHSRGGALAIIMANYYTDMYTHDKNVFVYTFGCPNATNDNFARIFNEKFQCLTPEARAFSYVIYNDVVPYLNLVSSGKCGFLCAITQDNKVLFGNTARQNYLKERRDNGLDGEVRSIDSYFSAHSIYSYVHALCEARNMTKAGQVQRVI